jgi:hypothetical protein
MGTFFIFLLLVPMSTVDDNWGRVSDTFVTEVNHDLKYPCVTAVLAFHIFGIKK